MKAVGSITFVPESAQYVAVFCQSRMRRGVAVDTAVARRVASFDAALAVVTKRLDRPVQPREVVPGRLWELIARATGQAPVERQRKS